MDSSITKCSAFRDPKRQPAHSTQNVREKMTSTGADVPSFEHPENGNGFHDAVMGTIDGILVVDDDGRVHFANPSAETLLGRPADQLLARPFGLPLGATDNIAELDLVRRDGQPLIIEMHVGPISWSGGDAFLVTLRDISTRKTAEKELRDSEERYALAAQGANDGLWDWDLKTNTITFSSRWKSIFGFSNSEVTDSPGEWLGRVHPDDRLGVEASVADHINGGSDHFESAHRMRDADGTYRWVLVRASAARSQ